MKSLILASTLSLSSLMLGSVAFGEEPSAAEKKIQQGKSMMNDAKAKMAEARNMKKAGKNEKKEKRKTILAGPACDKVVKECNSSGFVPGGHADADTGLVADCLAKVAKGHSVTGVTATKDDAVGCLKALKDGT
jgi:hypothetical protein